MGDIQGDRNILLGTLPENLRSDLAPFLKPFQLHLRQKIQARNARIDHIYFPQSGIVSVRIQARSLGSVEIAMVGWDGAIGISALFGQPTSPWDVVVNVAGDALCIAADDLCRAVAHNPSAVALFAKAADAFSVQFGETALANSCGSIEQRVARWILMAHDRHLGNAIPVTHELLASMLGVRRPGVSIAVGKLQKNGLVRSSRGSLHVMDRAGLMKCAEGYYGRSAADSTRAITPMER